MGVSEEGAPAQSADRRAAEETCADIVRQLLTKKHSPTNKRNLLRRYARSALTERLCGRLLELLEEDEQEEELDEARRIAEAQAAEAAVRERIAQCERPVPTHGDEQLRAARATGTEHAQLLAKAFARREVASAALRRKAGVLNHVCTARSLANMARRDRDAQRLPPLRREWWDDFNATEKERRLCRQRAEEEARISAAEAKMIRDRIAKSALGYHLRTWRLVLIEDESNLRQRISCNVDMWFASAHASLVEGEVAVRLERRQAEEVRERSFASAALRHSAAETSARSVVRNAEFIERWRLLAAVPVCLTPPWHRSAQDPKTLPALTQAA
eukprot:TRINITY_DN13592_c0_g1_i1.p1 TRINITY_DN13592_c0_g1~~TRINITY_DN13592_c0_g1_i1.p1  ORF type:complete len:330 (+),score=90.69 TRINITY_DN13592_c0_g1_i1:55-1044(+)